MLQTNTLVETHLLHGVPILVKREDLASPLPGPKFSKIRGVVAHIRNRPEPIIGVLDTLHSKAGWAVSYVCHHLGKQAINYWPRFKRDEEFMTAKEHEAHWNGGAPNLTFPRVQQQMAHQFGAMMVELKAGRSAILYHQAKKNLAQYGSDAYMMPNALKLKESVTENAEEAFITAANLPPQGTLVISISSGTVAAGVLQGFKRAGILDGYTVILHMGYSRSHKAVLDYMQEVAGFHFGANIILVDDGYSYADEVKLIDPPFPINPHYDAKAWKWLSNLEVLESLDGQPIVFWSIGD